MFQPVPLEKSNQIDPEALEAALAEVTDEVILYMNNTYPRPILKYSVEYIPIFPEQGSEVKISAKISSDQVVSQLFVDDSTRLIQLKSVIQKALESTYFRLPGIVNTLYMTDGLILHFGLVPSEREVPEECKERCPDPNTNNMVPVVLRDPTDPTFRPYQREYSKRVPIDTWDVASGDLYHSVNGKPLVGIKLKELGKGSFGSVALYQRDDGKQFAVKQTQLLFEDPELRDKDGNLIREARQYSEINVANVTEISLMLRLNHPLILKIDQLLLPTEVQGNRYPIGIVTPVLSGSLYSYRVIPAEPLSPTVRPLTNMQKLKYCYQVVAGVAYLHSRDVIHRDMKPENVLYDEEKDQMVIGDLGLGKALACSYRDIGISDFAFTLWYRPPELLLGGTYYYPGDVWSVGLVIYYILTGRDLFKGNKSTDMVLAIIKVLGGPTPESWDLVKALTSKSISGLTYSDLSIQTILKSYAGQVGNPSKIISLDTEMFEWSSLFLMTLQLNPANRASIFELLAAPIFNPVRDISLESSYINCLDNLYLRSAPMVLYAETVVKGERDFQDRFEQNINLTRNSRTDLLSWLLDVSRNFYLRRETYFMTVNLIDRYLPLSLMTQELPSFGLACLHIAVGHYEEYFFDTPLEELAVVGGDLVSIESIQSAAIEVLKRSKYDLLSATAIDFLREFYKSVLEKEADKAKIGKVYRISQGLLYASLFWENVLIYDAPRLALWSWNMASRYWNLTNPSSSISMYYDSLLPADNDISITDAMDIEGGNRIPGLVPDEVTRYFSAPVNGALDLPRIIAALAVSN